MGVIDYYINLLCEEMDQGKSGQYLPEAYKNLPFDLKMKLLVSNEAILLERKERTHESFLRMKGITQSYYMYDSLTFKKCKEMMKIISEQ